MFSQVLAKIGPSLANFSQFLESLSKKIQVEPGLGQV